MAVEEEEDEGVDLREETAAGEPDAVDAVVEDVGATTADGMKWKIKICQQKFE